MSVTLPPAAPATLIETAAFESSAYLGAIGATGGGLTAGYAAPSDFVNFVHFVGGQILSEMGRVDGSPRKTTALRWYLCGT